MRFRRLCGALVLGLFTGTLSGCDGFVPPDISPPPGQPAPTQPPPPIQPPAAQRLAVVEVLGGDVFVNGAAISGSRRLVENDKVSTGGNGRARIRFDVGGTLTMEPNSDPRLLLIHRAGCVAGQLVVMLYNGKFTARDVSNVCFVNPKHLATVSPASDFDIEITDQRFRLTVTSGRVLVSIGMARLSRYVVQAPDYIDVIGGGSDGPQSIIR